MAAVVSIPDDIFQEVGVAYVMAANPAPSTDELKTFAKSKLAGYKVPKQIFVVEDMPLLPIGKVDKQALRERLF